MFPGRTLTGSDTGGACGGICHLSSVTIVVNINNTSAQSLILSGQCGLPDWCTAMHSQHTEHCQQVRAKRRISGNLCWGMRTRETNCVANVSCLGIIACIASLEVNVMSMSDASRNFLRVTMRVAGAQRTWTRISHLCKRFAHQSGEVLAAPTQRKGMPTVPLRTDVCLFCTG